MVLRIALFIMMSIGLLGLGAVAWTAMRPHEGVAEASPKPPAAPRTILVAAAPLRAGDLIKPENIVAKEMPADSQLSDVSPDTQDARASLVGAMLKHALGKDEPLRSLDVMRPSEHGFLAAVVGQGMSAVTIGVDAISGTAGLISPGDRVDVILTGTNDDPSIPVGRRISAETVLTNVRVVAIDQQIVLGDAAHASDAQRAHTVTLETTAEAAQRVTVAARIGKLSLTVRSADPRSNAREVGPAAPIFASDVSHALAEPAPKPVANVLRVYPGTGDTREFRY